MDLIFQTTGGKPFDIEIGYFDTVLEIKAKLQKYKGIPISKQTLIFNGNVLPDDLNVHNSDILDRSRIHLVVASDSDDHDSQPPPKMRLRLKLPASKLLAVEVSVKDTIQRLKERIHELEGIPIGRLVIHANGIELADNKTMLECELTENSEVTVSCRPPPQSNAAVRPAPVGSAKLRVVVQYGTEKIPAEVSATENVGELRRKLQKMKLNLPQEGSFFIYNQNVMDDNRSFRWYEVGQGDTIEIFGGSVSGGS